MSKGSNVRGRMTHLGTLPGGSERVASSINSAGKVVGTAPRCDLTTARPVLDYANAMVAPQRERRHWELTGARRREAQARTADSAARARQLHREPLHRRGIEGAAGVRRLRRLPAEVDRDVRAGRSPEGGWDHAGDAGLHVLGSGTAVTRGIGMAQPNTCEGGVGAGATAFAISVPMPTLRQQ